MWTLPPVGDNPEPGNPPAKSRHRGSRNFVFSFFILVMLGIVIGTSIRLNIFEPEEIGRTDFIYPIADVDHKESGVEFGTYIVNIYNLDMNQKVFSADGWVWMRWPSNLQHFLEEKKMEPIEIIRMVNQVNAWDFYMEPEDKSPKKEADGHYYQRFKFSGSFYVNDLDFSSFPFHTLTLPLVFELEEQDLPPEFTHTKLLIDQPGSGLGRYRDIMGYSTTNFSKRTFMHEYATNMDGQQSGPGVNNVYQVRFEVSYRKSTNSTILRLLLPLCIVMVVVFASLYLPVSCFELRVTIPPTMVLSLIFLQQGYQQSLPDLNYITPMDAAYNACYLVNLILFVLFVFDIMLLNEAPEGQELMTIERIRRIDRWMQLVIVLFLFSATGLVFMAPLVF